MKRAKTTSILALSLMYLTIILVGYICSDCCNPNPNWIVNKPKCKAIKLTTQLN
jgi:hypothetical protein